MSDLLGEPQGHPLFQGSINLGKRDQEALVDLMHLDLPYCRLKLGCRGGLPQLLIFDVKDLRPPEVETLLDLPGVHLPKENPDLAQPQPAGTSLRSQLPPVECPLPLGPLQCRVCCPHSRLEGGEGAPEGLLDISLLDLGVLPPPAMLGVHLLMPKVGELLGLQLGF
jgi:hypothetical protein